MAIQNIGNSAGDKIPLGFVPTNYTRTVSSGNSDTTSQLSSHLNGVDSKLGSMDIWLSTPVTATSIMAAHDTLTNGGTIHIPDGYHTIAPNTVIISHNNVTLSLGSACTLYNSDGTKNLIKITGNNCSVIGGQIMVADLAQFTSTSGYPDKLWTAMIWNTGNNTTLNNVTFNNSYLFQVTNQGGDKLKVLNCRFYCNFTDIINGFPIVGYGYGNSGFYQDGGDYNIIKGCFFSYTINGISSGAYTQPAGNYLSITECAFDYIIGHPVYIADHSQTGVNISYNTHTNCGSSFQISGNLSKCNYNFCHIDYSLFESSPEAFAQSGLGIRGAFGNELIGNTITGRAGQIVLSIYSVPTAVSNKIVSESIVADNIIYMTSGTSAYSAIEIGSTGSTTRIDNIIVRNNIIKGVIQSDSKISEGLIRFTSPSPVVDKDLTTPPGSATSGTLYIVPSNATGAWAGQTNKIATATNPGGILTWVFTSPTTNVSVYYLQDERLHYYYNGSSWVASSSYISGNCIISGNIIELSKAAIAIKVSSAKGVTITDNMIVNNTDYGVSTVLYGIYLDRCCYSDISGNSFVNNVNDNQLTLYNLYESGTSSETFKNRFINNKFVPTITSRYTNSTLVSGGNSTADSTNITWT